MAIYRTTGARIGLNTVDKILGAGGGGVAYRAIQPNGNHVVLKLLGKPDKEQANFELELSTNTRILCGRPEFKPCEDYLVFVEDWIEDQGDIFLQQTYRIGGSLRNALKQHTTLTYGQARRVFKSITLGLQALHKAGYTHRDIKPDNILLGAKPQDAALADFGIAAQLHTRPRVPGYTSGYGSPEQMRGYSTSEAQDVFSLAASLYETLAGVRPYESASADEEEATILDASAQTASIAHAGQDIPAAAVQAIDAALSKNPLARPTLREFYDAL